jgi:hypothetical protein
MIITLSKVQRCRSRDGLGVGTNPIGLFFDSRAESRTSGTPKRAAGNAVARPRNARGLPSLDHPLCLPGHGTVSPILTGMDPTLHPHPEITRNDPRE